MAEAWITAPTLPALVARVVGHYRMSHEDGEEVLQETRIALWEAGRELVGVAWVAGVARHKAVDLVRRRLSARARIRTLSKLPEALRPEPEVGLLLHARVASLPARLREFYELHYVQGWSERELAAHFGLCRASVRWLDRTCRKAIAGTPKLKNPQR